VCVGLLQRRHETPNLDCEFRNASRFSISIQSTSRRRKKSRGAPAGANLRRASDPLGGQVLWMSDGALRFYCCVHMRKWLRNDKSMCTLLLRMCATACPCVCARMCVCVCVCMSNTFVRMCGGVCIYMCHDLQASAGEWGDGSGSCAAGWRCCWPSAPAA